MTLCLKVATVRMMFQCSLLLLSSCSWPGSVQNKGSVALSHIRKDALTVTIEEVEIQPWPSDRAFGSAVPRSDELGWTLRTTSVPTCASALDPKAPISQMFSLPILFNASQSKVTPGLNAYNQNHCLPYHGRGKWKIGESGFTKRQAFVFASFVQ